MRIIIGVGIVVMMGLQTGCNSQYDTSLVDLGAQLGDDENANLDDGSDQSGEPLPVVTPPETQFKYEPLSWEAGRPEAKNWSTYTFKVIREEAYDLLNTAIDSEVFCPNYNNMSKDQRINFFGALISGMTRYESNYNPRTRYHESTMGTDPVTRQPVYSEGLLQLSYQDVQWATYCEFDWSKDKNLSPTDPRKTIFDPYKNLRCGIKILANQVRRTKQILLTSGVYWAVLRKGGRYEKIDEIVAITKRLPFCNK